MLLALSALGADAKKIKDLLDEYIQVLYPEQDTAQSSFVERAHNRLDKHIGKPFIVDETSKGNYSMRTDFEAEKE
jgi:hypothetical protein